MSIILETDRLVLRPFVEDDVEAVQRNVSLWEIARMTTRIAHPYPEGAAADWIAGHGEARAKAQEHTFAITEDAGENEGSCAIEPIIGAISLRKLEPGNYELGYWLAPECWGRGLATDAARAMVVFGFEKLYAEALQSGHFIDNLASGRVLQKAGFAANGVARQWSAARQGFVDAHRLLLTRETWQRARQDMDKAP
ncbi:MAG: GNAT family N-acetyltransferase [Kiloniellaceae bacterium]